MTDPHANGRFDVVATGELLGSFDGADERARLLRALNADPDLCSALLCGEQSLLCSGVGWIQAQAFVELMRSCGVVAEVVCHGEDRSDDAELAGLSSVAVARPGAGRAGMLDAESMSAALKVLYGGVDPGLDDVAITSQRRSDRSLTGAPDLEQTSGEWMLTPESLDPDELSSAPLTIVQPQPEVFDAEEVAEPHPSLASTALRTTIRPTDVVVDGSGDIPTYLLEADARERLDRRRSQRRWGMASLLVLAVAMVAAFSTEEEVFNSSQAYVHVLASPVSASADGTVAELLVAPGQALQRGEAVAVITAAGAQRQIEVAAASGLVDQVAIEVGQRVDRGTALLTLAQPGSAYLLAYFPAEQLRELPKGGVVQIDLDDFPGQPVLGRLVVAGTARADERVREPVRIDFEDELPLLQRLRSGMAARVTVRRQQLPE